MNGIGLAITCTEGKADIKIKNAGCNISDLTQMIAFCDIAKDDLLKQLRTSLEKNKNE